MEGVSVVISPCLARWGGLTLASGVVGRGDTPPSYSCVLWGVTWLVHIQSENGGEKRGVRKGGGWRFTFDSRSDSHSDSHGDPV